MPMQDDVRNRLRLAIKADAHPLASALRKGGGLGIGGPIPDFEDHEAWARRVRLLFNVGPNDMALKKAFDVFGFDPCDPVSWRSLLQAMATVLEPEIDAVAAKPKKRGAKKKWVPSLRLELVLAVDRIQRESPTRVIDEDACAKLKKQDDIPSLFLTTGVGALVKQLDLGRRQLRRLAERGARELPASLKRKKKL
ncbi:MAG: hypothetical protein Q8M24_22940 [Pseudolabrys sp.]|nr:hypothetical protein [Pseudolabrys sp.]MDP2298309.1 hypothetical protein [Pseudolabrys sp.]